MADISTCFEKSNLRGTLSFTKVMFLGLSQRKCDCKKNEFFNFAQQSLIYETDLCVAKFILAGLCFIFLLAPGIAVQFKSLFNLKYSNTWNFHY